MGFHNCHQTSLQFITGTFIPGFSSFLAFFYVFILFLVSTWVSLCSPRLLLCSLGASEDIKKHLSLKRRHFVRVTSCLEGARGGQSNIPSMLGANGRAKTNNTPHSCVCVCVYTVCMCVSVRFVFHKCLFVPQSKALSLQAIWTRPLAESWAAGIWTSPLSPSPLLHLLAPCSQMYPQY